MSVITLTKDNFEDEVLNSDVPVLVDFWASWCGPCRMISPIIEEIAAEENGIKVGKVNVDDEPELASTYNIMSIPQSWYLNGEVVNVAGARPKSALSHW